MITGRPGKHAEQHLREIMNPFQTTPRKRLTDQQRAKLFLERGGKCAECGIKIRSGMVWEFDHALSLENGGNNEPDNLVLLCRNCHASKTPSDRAKAAKARAIATRGIVPEAHRQKSSLAKRPGMKYDWKARRYVREEDASRS